MGKEIVSEAKWTCDRCGVATLSYKDDYKDDLPHGRGWVGRFELVLCPKCAESFDRWMEEGKRG